RAVLVFTYDEYRERWLVLLIMSMMEKTFGVKPKESYLGPSFRMLTVHNSNIQERESQMSQVLPSDDWPFLYLKNRSIPSFYLTILAIISAISLLSTVVVLRI